MISIQDIIYHSKELASNAIYANPARINAIHQTISYFQEITSITVNITEGILWINNQTTICHGLKPVLNTSSENKERNKINNIDNILGVR